MVGREGARVSSLPGCVERVCRGRVCGEHQGVRRVQLEGVSLATSRFSMMLRQIWIPTRLVTGATILIGWYGFRIEFCVLCAGVSCRGLSGELGFLLCAG